MKVQNNTHCHSKIKNLQALHEHHLTILNFNIQEKIVKSLHTDNNIRDILTLLKNKEIKNLIIKDVFNLVYQKHLKNLCRHTSLKALFNSLQNKNVSEFNQNKLTMI